MRLPFLRGKRKGRRDRSPEKSGRKAKQIRCFNAHISRTVDSLKEDEDD